MNNITIIKIFCVLSCMLIAIFDLINGNILSCALFFVISCIPGFLLIICRDCTADCWLSDVCEKTKKIKFVKRIMIFCGYNEEKIKNIPIKYIDHTSYRDIYKDIKEFYNNYDRYSNLL